MVSDLTLAKIFFSIKAASTPQERLPILTRWAPGGSGSGGGPFRGLTKSR